MFDETKCLRLAAIDIGSNAARLLICHVIETNNNPQFVKLNLVRVPLRLGFDVFESGSISVKKELDIINTLHAYKYLMQVHKVNHYIACATSAMRDSSNSHEIIARIQNLTGINIKILSGKEEAESIYENHIENNLDKEHSYLYIDVGGGSTELTLFDNNRPVFEESFDIGTVRMLKNKVTDTEWHRCKNFVKTEARGFKNLMGIGSGGNINKVFSLSKVKQGKPISTKIIKDYFEEFTNMTVEERMVKYDLREDRADVILPALQIYISIMKWAGIEEIYIPKFGLADGLVKKLYRTLTN